MFFYIFKYKIISNISNTPITGIIESNFYDIQSLKSMYVLFILILIIQYFNIFF